MAPLRRLAALLAVICIIDIDEMGYVFTDCIDVALPQPALGDVRDDNQDELNENRPAEIYEHDTM